MVGVVLVGAGLVLLLRFENRKLTNLLVAFSGAFLLSLIFLHLLPPVFSTDLPMHGGFFVLGGFCIQLFLEYLSGGVEHGHDHAHGHGHRGFPLMIFIGLSLHAFLEGMPIGHLDHEHNHSLLVGILLHKLPVAVVLTVMLREAGLPPLRVGFWLLLFGLMSPLGSWAFGVIEGWGALQPEQWVAAATGVLVGILLHVATTILFEGSEGHKYNGLKLLVLATGLVLGGLV